MIFDPATLRPDESHYYYLPYPNSPTGRGRTFIKYFYKALSGEIFTTVARSLELAKRQRDCWLAERELASAARAGRLHGLGMVAA